MKLHICKALWIVNLWFFFSNLRAKCQNIPWWVWFLQNLGSHWNNRHWWCRVDENLLGPGKFQCGSISSSICSSWNLECVVSVESVGQGFTLPMSVYTVVPTGVSSYTCKHNHLTLHQFKKKHMCFEMQRTMHGWMLCVQDRPVDLANLLMLVLPSLELGGGFWCLLLIMMVIVLMIIVKMG